MTEETVQTQEPSEPQVDPIEAAALEKGWKPKDQYAGDPASWRSAEVFLALEEPIKRIEQYSKELKATRQAFDALKQHHSKVKETEYNRALKTLQDAKKEARRNGEHDQADILDERIEEIKTEKQEFEQSAQRIQVQPTAEISPEFTAWVNRNSWYENNPRMRAVADEIGKELHREGESPSRILKLVEEEIRKEFPNRFTNERAKRPAAVEASTRNGTNSSGEVQLTEQQRIIMNKLVKAGAITEAKYKADIAAMKD